MEPLYLKLLKELSLGTGKEAIAICEKIVSTPLEIPCLPASLISVLEIYYAGIVQEHCSSNTHYSRTKLEKIIREIENLLNT